MVDLPLDLCGREFLGRAKQAIACIADHDVDAARRVASRYVKLLADFMGFVKLAAIAIWLK